jgi:hypothetical protein
MAEDHSLPGWPKKKLVKDVPRHLGRYGIRPIRSDLWRATWAWAEKIGRSYWHMHWPQAWEIGTQYILLLLIQMKENRSLRLPYRAADHIPPEVAALLPVARQPELLAIADDTRKKRTPQRSARRPGAKRDTGRPTAEIEPTPS